LDSKTDHRIQTGLPVPVKRRIRLCGLDLRRAVHLNGQSQNHHMRSAERLVQPEREEGGVSTSGAFGLRSPEGLISSALDLRLTAFSISNAASSGFPVARAKLNNAIAWRDKYALPTIVFPQEDVRIR
jgi:hypothetical protein